MIRTTLAIVPALALASACGLRDVPPECETRTGPTTVMINEVMAANALTNALEEIGVLRETTGRKTYRMFADYWPSADPAVEPVAGPIAALPGLWIGSSVGPR